MEESEDSEIVVQLSSAAAFCNHKKHVKTTDTCQKNLVTGQEIIQNLSVVDIVLAISHLCHFFFRVTRFNFHSVQDSLIIFYEFCWICLFGLYLLQLFMGIILFITAKDCKEMTQVTFKCLINSCQWWITISTFLLVLNGTDGFISSMPSNPEITVNSGTEKRNLTFKVWFIESLTIDTVAFTGEFLFRLCALIWMKKFVRQFYKLEILFSD